MDYIKLTKDLIKAKQAALKFQNANDGGTCNFDTFVLKAKNLRWAKLKEAVENAGLMVSNWEHGRYHIMGYESGQANRRTDMVEEFERVMDQLGYETTVYYCMD